MPAGNSFEARVLIHDDSESVRLCKDYLEQEAYTLESAGRLKLQVEFAAGADDLVRRIAELTAQTAPVE